MSWKLVQADNGVTLVHDGKAIGEFLYLLRVGEVTLTPEKVSRQSGNIIRVIFREAELMDEFVFGEGLVSINRHWNIYGTGRWRMMFDYRPLQNFNKWLVPSVMYDKNEMGTGHFPRGGLDRGWSFREDRIPIPSCSILYNGSDWQSVFTSPAMDQDEISSVKTYIKDGEPAFSIRVPYTEEPYTYTEKGVVIGGLTSKTEKFFKVEKASFSYERTFYVACGRCEHISDIYKKLTVITLSRFESNTERVSPVNWSAIASLKFRHLIYLLIDNPAMSAIKMGKGNGLFQSFYEYTAGSFLVQSLLAAFIFARAAKDLHNDEYLELAIRIGEFFLAGALPGGLHRDCYSLKEKRWGGYIGVGTPKELQDGANARCNGEVMVNYLRLYILLQEAARPTTKFLNLAALNADFYIKHQLKNMEEGSFGRWWDISGQPLNTLGTNGCYIISLLVELEKATGKRDDIDIALDRAGRYYASLIDNSGFYADTLDADCVDREAGCALLRAFLDLYERSPNGFYLKYAKLAAGFILSWMFTYDVPFDPMTPLGKRNFKTSGMTAVSVAHHHLDFYGLYIAYDFFRLWEATKDELWKKCGLLMMNACGQLISDSGDLLGRSKDYTGWQPEQINHTNWDYKLRFLGTKGRFHTCVAWTVVLTLGAMFDIRARFPDILDFKLDKAALL